MSLRKEYGISKAMSLLEGMAQYAMLQTTHKITHNEAQTAILALMARR